MDPVTISLALGAITTGLGVYGALTGASAQAEASRKNAELKKFQAQEIMERQAINERLMREQVERQGLKYQASFSATGREGSGIGGVLYLHSQLEEQIKLQRREAQFKAEILGRGGEADLKLASDITTAGYLSGAGILTTGASQGFSDYNRYKKTSAEGLS